MRVVHRGFDTLEVAIRANIDLQLFDYLSQEKDRAEFERREVEIEWKGVSLLLKGHGGGGYKFIAHGGPDGAHWAIKKPNVKDPWGLRVKFGSSFMADHGLGRARAYLHDTLEKLDLRIGPNDISIGRVDFCVDFLMPGFQLEPEDFVMHSHANRADHFAVDEEKQVNGKSGRTTSVTIGKMPGRQVIIYDKRAEIVSRHKPEWWVRWNATLARDGLPPLDPTNPTESRVWRVELRAGKNLLKSRWGITTWADLDDKLGDLMADTLKRVRYTAPDPHDTNRARWSNHALWNAMTAEIDANLFEMRSGAEANAIKQVRKDEHIAMITANARGSLITLAALHEQKVDDLPRFMKRIGMEFSQYVILEQEHAARKLSDASERYVFV